MEELHAGGEGHPEELHLLPVLLREALVPEVRCKMATDALCQFLGLFFRLSQLIPQLQTVCAATSAGGQVPVTCHHL